MENKDHERIPFKQVLDALLDDTHLFPPVYLHRFSDLDAKNLNALKDIWAQVPVIRRRALLEDLEEIAEVDTLVSFEDLARYALNDEDAQVRMTAIRLLWEDEDRKLVPTFIRMMEHDPDSQVRAAAATALGLFVYLGELEEIPEETHQLVEDKLILTVKGEDLPLVRRRALEALGFSSREEVSDLLRENYERGNIEWLASALYAMGRSADNKWGPAVMRMFSHPEAEVREEAVRAAGELELTAARDALIDALQDDSDENVQMAAVWSLSQIGGNEVRPLLERLLSESEDDAIADFIEEALENLSFTEDMANFEMFDIDLDEDETGPAKPPKNSGSNPESKRSGGRKSKK